jgi:mRNA interferase RelE/StbE
MYKLELSSKVKKFIVKRTLKEQKRLIEIFETLQENPYENDLPIKPMKGSTSNEYRLRFGKYRIIYEVIDDELLIYLIDANSRGDIYKK